MKLTLIATTILTATLALPSFAAAHGHRQSGYNQNDYAASCSASKSRSRAAGGLLGAVGGAAAGRALAASSVRPEGVILGTVVGAIIGTSAGNANVDCSEPELYTQGHGRSYGNTGNYYTQSYGQSYGQQPVYQPPVYQQPVYQPPVYQAPVYPQPVYQQPVYQQPVYQPPVYQQPVYQPPVQQQPVYQTQVVAGEDWYQPSPQSYYGQERRGPLVGAPAPYGRPDQVPSDSYVAHSNQGGYVTQTYQSSGTYVVAPPGAPCGYQVCQR